jgi:hypothetical protein
MLQLEAIDVLSRDEGTFLPLFRAIKKKCFISLYLQPCRRNVFNSITFYSMKSKLLVVVIAQE